MVPTIAILSAGNLCWRHTAKQAKKALDSVSYNTVEIDVDDNIAEKLRKLNPDLAFIGHHRSYCKDGCIQGLLEILGIKYTHSGVLASAMAADKVMSMHIFQSLGIDIPKGYVISREDILSNKGNIDYPYILKPINEGGSLGLHYIFSHNDYLRLKNDPSDLREKMIIQEFVPGVDLSTAVLLDEAVGTIEIRTENGLYDHETKYMGHLEKVLALDIPETIYKMTLEFALKAHRFLGCKTVSRSDFRYNPENNSLKMLEINTHPGLRERASFSKIVKLSKGIDCNEVINMIVKDSLQSIDLNAHEHHQKNLNVNKMTMRKLSFIETNN